MAKHKIIFFSLIALSAFNLWSSEKGSVVFQAMRDIFGFEGSGKQGPTCKIKTKDGLKGFYDMRGRWDVICTKGRNSSNICCTAHFGEWNDEPDVVKGLSKEKSILRYYQFKENYKTNKGRRVEGFNRGFKLGEDEPVLGGEQEGLKEHLEWRQLNNK